MNKQLKYRRWGTVLFAFPFMLCLLLSFIGIGVASAQGAETIGGFSDSGLIAIGAGISMAGGAIGAGAGISGTGAAAIGVIAEKPEAFGRVLIFVALAEALAIYGLLFALMLWIMM